MRLPAFLVLSAAMIAPCQEQPTIKTTASEVVLDLVVRDKKERFVRDLQAGDVQALEDGVRQKIKSFRFVDGAEPAASETAATMAAPAATAAAPRPAAQPAINPLREINLVSIIFGMIAPKDRAFARDVSKLFIENEIRPNTLIGVFSLDYRLNILQPFTSDRALISAALDRAATGAYSEFLKTSVAVERGMSVPSLTAPGTLGESTIAQEQQLNSFFTTSNPLAGVVNTIAGSTLFAGNHMDLGYHSSIRTLITLLHMFQGQAAWPGRKTVLYLSYGVPVDPPIKDLFRSVISTANNAGVTVYGLDVRGLYTGQGQAEDKMGPQIQISNAPTGIDAQAGAAYAEGGYGGLFRREYMGQSDPIESLRELAESTGGFLIYNTNRPAAPLRRVMEDVRTHYELSYTPTSGEYDGRFRTISVKVLRPGVKVQTRAGYYALPSLEGRPVLPFESGTLKALSMRPLPHDFEYHASAIRFRPGPGAVQYVLAFEVPASQLEVVEDKKTDTCRVRASFTALIKDANGRIVDKISGDVPYSAPLEKAAAVRRGAVSFTGSFSLPPGRYTLETAAIDRETLKTSARRSVLVVPAAKAAGISEVALARSVASVRQPSPDNPLESPAGKITPALGGTVPQGMDLMLYSVLYPDPAASDAPHMTIELVKEGRTVVRGNLELGPADESGAVPMLASFPVAKLQPGEYEVRATFDQGTLVVKETTAVRIAQP